MKDFRMKFIEKIPRTPTVISFRFFPQERVDFLPGQFMRLIFDEHNPGNKELNKYLSLSCGTDKGYIEVTKRISASSFSNKLLGLNKDDSVSVQGPLGSCVFEKQFKKVSFLVGGIGITPVISMLEYVLSNKIQSDISVFYSNRNEEEIAFKKQLDDWMEINKSLKVYYTVTECAPKDKNCFYGGINKELLSANICDAQERVIFIFGPPKMVEAMQVLAQGINCPQTNIKTEKFIGY
ncbi:MAG: FAD-binding oxidoreductase [Candidatus Omnitrophica bacterium]|jgi:ferredoxin-NADP reductase|nr:FAD-binding oxidoreductase [Candidatus Omnitrophota bacterium]